MTDAEIIARAERAKTYRDELLAPILNEQRAVYANRIVEIAATELNPKVREQKITALSYAVRILRNIETGLDAFVNDGEVAKGNKLRVEKIEKMTEPQRRLLGIAPY